MTKTKDLGLARMITNEKHIKPIVLKLKHTHTV